jgi:hypothetical protein
MPRGAYTVFSFFLHRCLDQVQIGCKMDGMVQQSCATSTLRIPPAFYSEGMSGHGVSRGRRAA